MADAVEFLKRCLPPASPAVSGPEWVRSLCGGLVGILLTGFLSTYLLGTSAPLLIAPMGASAVLLFGVPASPLAQPWSIIGGNFIASTIGVVCVFVIPDTVTAAAVAVALTIAMMQVARCIHPPSGAVALTTVLAAPLVHQIGFLYVVSPVGINTAVLLGTALFFNSFVGRTYPHRTPAPVRLHGTLDPRPSERIGFTTADLDAVLRQHGEGIDITRDELDFLFHEAEMRAYERRFGTIRARDIMSRDVIMVTPRTSQRDARRLLREHDIKALPVVSEDRHLVGIVTQTDLMEHHRRHRRVTSAPGRLVRRLFYPKGGPIVASVLTSSVLSVQPEMAATELVPMMTDSGYHHLPVVDASNRLVGIISQSDLIAALFSSRVLEPEATPTLANDDGPTALAAAD